MCLIWSCGYEYGGLYSTAIVEAVLVGYKVTRHQSKSKHVFLTLVNMSASEFVYVL